jgi:hypothetical protein
LGTWPLDLFASSDSLNCFLLYITESHNSPEDEPENSVFKL